jgi:RNA polymerase sigma-70 factor (ECF subfamily)
MAADKSPCNALWRNAEFTTTHWSVVVAARGAASSASTEALETLCRTYWYPLYAYLRRSGHQPPDAEDIIQGFFVRFIERQFLSEVDRSKGRFRSFLLAALKHFVEKQRRKEQTLKRGGGFTFVGLEVAEAQYDLELPTALPPEHVYDRSWAQTLIHKARTNLSKEYSAVGKASLWETLQPYLSDEPEGLLYADLAEALRMTTGAVKMAVLRMRRRYGELLRREIGETVSRPEEIDDEIRYLCAVMGS